jgi:hypothetical protein
MATGPSKLNRSIDICALGCAEIVGLLDRSSSYGLLPGIIDDFSQHAVHRSDRATPRAICDRSQSNNRSVRTGKVDKSHAYGL